MKQTMFTFYLVTVLLGLSSCKSANNSNKTEQHSSTLTIIVTESYCGGARPSEELEQQLSTPHPYINKTIYLVSANGKIESLKTNESGQTIISNEIGSYNLFTEEKHLAKIGPHDPEGCKSWKEKADYVYDLKNDVTASIIQFHISCNRCIPPAP